MVAIETLTRSVMTSRSVIKSGKIEEPTELRTQGKTPTELSPAEPQLTPSPSQGRRGTAPYVEPDERGNEKLYDEAEYTGGVQRAQVEETSGNAGEAARVRSELARELLHRVERLVPLVGDVSLPVNIQLLKRDLSHCHDALRAHPSESDFLSIITLVESAMTQTRWKEYSRSQFERIRSAVEVGYRQSHVEYADYERIRRDFAEGDIDTHPRINLDSLSLEDITDAEDD
jgi:hypothetical protein